MAVSSSERTLTSGARNSSHNVPWPSRKRNMIVLWNSECVRAIVLKSGPV
jgi:hypothetical protein